MIAVLRAIIISVVGVTVTMIVTLAIPPVAEKIPFALFFGMIAITSWYCGRRTGYLTIVLSCLATNYFLFEPRFEFGLNSAILIQTAFLAVVASGINELISMLKRTREAISRERTWLNVTLHSIGDAVIATDEHANVVFLNPVAERMCGWSSQEAVGQPLKKVFNIINEQTRKPAENPVTRVLREGVVVGLANHTALVSRDGKETPIEDSAAPIREGNRIIGTVMVFHDVSDRRKAETAVQENEERYRLALNAGKIGVWDWDIPSNKIKWTDEFYEIFGLKRGDFDGTKEGFFNLIYQEDRDRAKEIVEDALKKQSGFHMEFRLLLQNGEMRWITTDGQVAAQKDGKPVRMVGSTRDITLKKGYENQLKFLKESAESANRAKDEFLAVVSHELRTPLTSILGWVRMLQAPDLDPQNRQRGIQVIERNARAQATLVEDLLDVSRIISGKLVLKLDDLDLRAIILSALETVRPSAEAKEIILLEDLPDTPLHLRGDANRLQQIVYNLLSNAIKFTPRGGRVCIAAKMVESQIEICVSDSGIGIDPSFLPFVFDRFKQADASTTRIYQGLGLGLAIVRHLVELHGGSVRAESAGKEKGATFTVTLPPHLAKRVTDTAVSRLIKSDKPNPKVDPMLLQGTRVMVVEDEPDSRDLLKFILEQFGAQANAVSSVPEAMSQFQKFKPHVLLSDIGLPEQDGYDLIKRIRALPHNDGGGIPAIALTAFAKSEDRDRALNSGYQRHIAKPVEPSDLAFAIASLRSTDPR